MMHLSQFTNYIFNTNKKPSTNFKIEIRPKWSDQGVTQFKLNVGYLISSKSAQQEKEELEKNLEKSLNQKVKMLNQLPSSTVWGYNYVFIDIQRDLPEILLKNINEMMTVLKKDWENSKINIEFKFVLNFDEEQKHFSFDTKKIESATHEKASEFLGKIVDLFRSFEPRNTPSKATVN
jgi:hypothetical protein